MKYIHTYYVRNKKRLVYFNVILFFILINNFYFIPKCVKKKCIKTPSYIITTKIFENKNIYFI